MDSRAQTAEQSDGGPRSALKLYEAQFFGFTPQTCMLRVCGAFQDCLCDILAVVEKVCVRQLSRREPGATELVGTRARECTRKLQRFLLERFKQLSERMQGPLVDRCFSVPPNVLLPEDKAHETCPADAQDMLRLESSLVDLHRAYDAEVSAQQALQAELEEQEDVQKQLDGLLVWVRELQAAWVTEGNGSFPERFQLMMQSVKKLQENIGEVCSKTPL